MLLSEAGTEVDFEKLMAESRIDDISMQRTVIRGISRINSFTSEVESINEVDKMYTEEERKINKLMKRANLKMAGLDNEIFIKEPKSTGEFMKFREQYDQNYEKLNKIKEMIQNSKITLMEFLENPESNQPLAEINGHSSESEGENEKEEFIKKLQLEKSPPKIELSSISPGIRSRMSSKRTKKDLDNKPKLEEIAESIKEFNLDPSKNKLTRRKSKFSNYNASLLQSEIKSQRSKKSGIEQKINSQRSGFKKEKSSIGQDTTRIGG